MRAERNQGIDGHNPYDKRREALKNKYLSDYQVDSLSQLPINFDGIVMQADEEYGNLVWDKHFGRKIVHRIHIASIDDSAEVLSFRVADR